MKRLTAIADYWLALALVVIAVALAATVLGCNEAPAGPADEYVYRLSYASDDYVRVYWDGGPAPKTYAQNGNVTWTSRYASTWVRVECNNPDGRINATLYRDGVEKAYDTGTGAVYLRLGVR